MDWSADHAGFVIAAYVLSLALDCGPHYFHIQP